MSQTNVLRLPSDEFIKRGVGVALHYGFMPSRRVVTSAKRGNTTKVLRKTKRPNVPRGAYDQHTAEMHTAIQTYVENRFNTLPQPVLFYHSNLEHKTVKLEKKDDPIFLTLQVMGTEKSIAEAMVIKTALTVLSEVGVENTNVHINTIGDKDSTIRYSRELSSFLRKNSNDMPVQAHTLLKRDPLQSLSYLYRKGHPLVDQAPRSIEFLSEPSRKHLKEVLEFLEAVEIPYEIDSGLVGLGDCYCQVLFEIREKVPADDSDVISDTIYARGGRYDDFSKKLFRQNIPAAGVIIESVRQGKNPKSFLNPKRIRQPKLYFIQFGFEAKLQSLAVLELLRKARIPVHQSLGSDKLTGQLEWADRLKIPYTIIMGQKETVDGTVILRNMSTRSQEIIPLDMLTDRLKAIK